MEITFKEDKIWLVFDLDNGDESKGHYVWWFHTRKQAREHIKFQKKQKFAAKLSQPICYIRNDSFWPKSDNDPAIK